eukprot:gb/GEZN01010303.1/.p1 GENE.gb/GEZN01010303.1/~~gb/GEZN01010303.1/.p1  ORF type:complete len:361 (+),score=76.66 gb/GEZN01010303.1/:50-1132(+)
MLLRTCLRASRPQLSRQTQYGALSAASRYFSSAPSKTEIMDMLKTLRERTGAPIKDCKDAINTSIEQGLFEKAGIFEKAVEFLRIKGVATAAKKSGRTANEGLVAVSTKDNFGVVIEVTSETDFTSRNADFQKGVASITQAALSFAKTQPVGALDIKELLKAPLGASTVDNTIVGLVTAIRENIHIRRAHSMQVEQGVVSAYVHQAVVGSALPADVQLGPKIAVVAVKSKATDKDALKDLGKKLAMQVIAAMPPPSVINPQEISATALEKEINVHREQIQAQPGWEKKPEKAISKMMEGLLNKFYEQQCLMKQPFLINTDASSKASPKVESFVQQVAKQVQDPELTITEFWSFKVGEQQD